MAMDTLSAYRYAAADTPQTDHLLTNGFLAIPSLKLVRTIARAVPGNRFMAVTVPVLVASAVGSRHTTLSLALSASS
jgi:hypothetical protein